MSNTVLIYISRVTVGVMTFIVLGAAVFAQKTTLSMETGKAAVTKTFKPKTKSDADLYYVFVKKGQEISIKVTSNSIYLSKGNECGIYYRLFDNKGKEFIIGDSPAGIDHWSGYVDAEGIYQFRIYMGCLESFTTTQLLAKKPNFKYTLSIVQPVL